jgi:CO/xanthine dehydrogenase Mo-binding subunit
LFKKGMALMPICFGISFTKTLMNQARSLVHVYTDGSVGVSTAGVEMGQGLHTKIAQVAARELNLPLEYIRVAGNSTDTIVNAPATAASTGFDLNGGAVATACRTLRTRLESFLEERAANGDGEKVAYWRANWRHYRALARGPAASARAKSPRRRASPAWPRSSRPATRTRRRGPRVTITSTPTAARTTRPGTWSTSASSSGSRRWSRSRR